MAKIKIRKSVPKYSGGGGSIYSNLQDPFTQQGLSFATEAEQIAYLNSLNTQSVNPGNIKPLAGMDAGKLKSGLNVAGQAMSTAGMATDSSILGMAGQGVSFGSTIGSLFGPAGTAIGAGVGALGGGIYGAIMEKKEAEERRRQERMAQARHQNTRTVMGSYGINPILHASNGIPDDGYPLPEMEVIAKSPMIELQKEYYAKQNKMAAIQEVQAVLAILERNAEKYKPEKKQKKEEEYTYKLPQNNQFFFPYGGPVQGVPIQTETFNGVPEYLLPPEGQQGLPQKVNATKPHGSMSKDEVTDTPLEGTRVASSRNKHTEQELNTVKSIAAKYGIKLPEEVLSYAPKGKKSVSMAEILQEGEKRYKPRETTPNSFDTAKANQAKLDRLKQLAEDTSQWVDFLSPSQNNQQPVIAADGIPFNPDDDTQYIPGCIQNCIDEGLATNPNASPGSFLADCRMRCLYNDFPDIPWKEKPEEVQDLDLPPVKEVDTKGITDCPECAGALMRRNPSMDFASAFAACGCGSKSTSSEESKDAAKKGMINPNTLNFMMSSFGNLMGYVGGKNQKMYDLVTSPNYVQYMPEQLPGLSQSYNKILSNAYGPMNQMARQDGALGKLLANQTYATALDKGNEFLLNAKQQEANLKGNKYMQYQNWAEQNTMRGQQHAVDLAALNNSKELMASKAIGKTAENAQQLIQALSQTQYENAMIKYLEAQAQLPSGMFYQHTGSMFNNPSNV